jgi:hypothetical protein
MGGSFNASQLIASGNDMPDQVGNNTVTDTTTSGQLAAPDAELVGEVNSKYTAWRADRRPYEAIWAFNAAMIRGLHNTQWNPALNILESRKTPSHRSRESINLILPKVKAKLSKFLKSRAIPIVQAASTDHEDILNAKATTKVLEYLWDKLQLEEKYEEVLLWSMQTGKAFWWFYWNTNAIAQVREPEDILGNRNVLDVPLGDVGVEVGTSFELLVSDPGVTRIQNQPEIMRVKLRRVADLEKQYQLPAGSIKPEVKERDIFQYQRQIAMLGARASTGLGASTDSEGKNGPSHAVVKELFTAPNASFPQGRYVVVAGDQILHSEQELPYSFATSTNPYPVEEFADNLTAGQFWPTTMVEQLTGLNKQYNRIRNSADEGLKLQTHPKMFYPKQAGLAKDAWNSEAGEKIPINWQPGMPPPNQWIVQPPNIAQDVWRMIDVIRDEMDRVTNLYPAAVGAEGASSGFDTNLLQEAADSVHAPDIRRNELALRGAAFKIRRLAKMGYDIPRLIAINGKDKAPQVFEFSHEQIDEHANIIIDTGSSLPLQKHARIDAILKLDERQAFGPVGDPSRNRKLMRMLDLGSQEEEANLSARDEEHARLENISFTRNEPVEDPMPWEDHDVEYEIHTDLLKSPEIKSWPPQQRALLVRHVILHVKWKNPQNAMQLAAIFGMQDVVQEIQQTMMIEQQFAQPPAAQPGQQPSQGQQQQPAAQAQPAPRAA